MILSPASHTCHIRFFWKNDRYCGYGLVVERVLAKDEIGVRFPVSAQTTCAPARIRTWNSSSEDCRDIRFTTGAMTPKSTCAVAQIQCAGYNARMDPVRDRGRNEICMKIFIF